MIANGRRLTRVLIPLLTIAIAQVIRGGTMVPMELKDLPGQASVVALGHVISVRTTQRDGAVLEKLATVKVIAVLRGTYTERALKVRTRTGLVFFDRHLEVGDAGVLFLKPSARGDFEAAYPGSFALFEEGTFKPWPKSTTKE